MKSAFATFSAGEPQEETPNPANEVKREGSVNSVKSIFESSDEAIQVKEKSVKKEVKAEPKQPCRPEEKVVVNEPKEELKIDIEPKPQKIENQQHLDDKIKQVGKVNRNGNSFPQNYVLFRVDQSDCIIQIRNGVHKFNGRVNCSVESLVSKSPLEFSFSDESQDYSVLCPTNHGNVKVQLTNASETISQLTVFIPIQYQNDETKTVEQVIVYDCVTKLISTSSSCFGTSSLSPDDNHYFTANVTENVRDFTVRYEAPNVDSQFCIEIPKRKGCSLVEANVKHNVGTTRDLRCFQL